MSPVHLVEHYGPEWAAGPYERGTDGPRVIMAGVDLSPTALRGASYAAGLARRQRSRLVLVHVVVPSAWAGMTVAGAADVQQRTFEEVIEQLRGELQSGAAQVGVPISFVVRRGEAFSELRDAATEAHADMVVVGASEQAGHRLVGSVANKLVRAATWPVVVVP
jgi:nucleotide-binding universal stress UspA family protein